jgi:23S rRNA (adenine2503-C2)-methyltransferase
MKYERIRSSDENVSKFVFRGDDIAVETVLYKYPDYKTRTVLCISTQCGCPVGCKFCGTGKFFIRNLSYDEIIEQAVTVLSLIDCKPKEVEKLQIMFMSMGEPFLNYDNVKISIMSLHSSYPSAQLLLSTSAPSHIKNNFENFINLSRKIPQIGLQFSIHESTDSKRKELISKDTLPLAEIASLGELWAQYTERKPFFNYCVHEENSKDNDIKALAWHFKSHIWEATLSVICEKDQTMKNAIENKYSLVKNFSEKLSQKGFGTRVFSPAGQDDIGGGCGQLWYFQNWLKEKGVKK